MQLNEVQIELATFFVEHNFYLKERQKIMVIQTVSGRCFHKKRAK